MSEDLKIPFHTFYLRKTDDFRRKLWFLDSEGVRQDLVGSEFTLKVMPVGQPNLDITVEGPEDEKLIIDEGAREITIFISNERATSYIWKIAYYSFYQVDSEGEGRTRFEGKLVIR